MVEIRSLNMLRGLAAFIVIIGHYVRTTNLFGGYIGRGSGQLGVMLFFILSGFLMSYLYLQKAHNSLEIKAFLISRIARVLPLFLILVFFSYVFQSNDVIGCFYNIPDYKSFLSHVFLLHGASVFWTIPPEIHFYAFFVFLWWVYSHKKSNLFFLLLFIYVVLLYYKFPRINGVYYGFPFDISLLQSLPYFIVGMLFGLLFPIWSAKKNIQSKYFILMLAIIPVLYPQVFEILFHYRHELWQDVMVLMAVSAVFFSVVFLVPKGNLLLENKIGDFIGKISYSLYLLHMLVLKQFKILAIDKPLVYFTLYIACTVLIAYISYAVIEKPIRNIIRNKFIK